jgi:hypothetical protein
MKKSIFYLIIATVVMTSCYDDYITDYDYTSVYFPYQTDVRTFVVGEGMSIKMGVGLGGITNNNIDRIVEYTLDNSLITPDILATMKNGLNYVKSSVSSVSTLMPLPSNYFTLSDDSKMIIESGMNGGTVTVKADSTLFLSDPVTINAGYALPFYIVSADADSILKDKRYAVIGVKYENMLFGKYWHGGITIIKDASGNNIDTTVYKTTIPSPESKIWTLTTVGPNSLVTNGYSDNTTSKGEMLLTLASDKILITTNSGSTYDIEADGESTFNRAKLLQDRKIYLNYKYINADGNTCYARDTLTFRNRIRDGVNEWQDEGPSHY